MSNGLSAWLLGAATLGLGLILVQALALRRHVGGRPERPTRRPPVSILKPLCGLDDDLELNLESFAALEWPDLEILLGVRSPRDAAWPLARGMALRHPGRFRVVVQRGEPGHNPKVNQLVTLAGVARHDLLVVSDSNVRVEPDYLDEIAALLEDPKVGLVTHAIVGAGERRLGSLFDHLHLSGYVSPGVVAAKCLLGADIVVGKSMAFRREDLEALGGFEAAKDVLAEDFVLGRMVSRRLGKRVAVARRPIVNVSQRRGLFEFTGRYTRWSVLHRTTTGRCVHLLQATLNPVLLGTAALLADPGATTSAALGAICATKILVDGFFARLLRPGGFRGWQLLMVPVKDLVFAWCWASGLVRSHVRWRGQTIRVLAGTRIGAPAPAVEDGALIAASRVS
jgi:ceramide glucosyltransferase